ncbi:1,2-phenylacetyl-CoA epoxidase subunit PaaD [Shouchella lonarensis]|uniref:Ring-1,2-phenylacetyl-CoA epoxidase subunit PaaD n=1 Tax=Shouchella lonarensis TaxID=1464122 RepID=A0A1G6H9V6_9BACI|nr:1,2-phenylacetyl-CoA epoxidase subunit PaaD [Shouchella lonarensis]SDB90725.1 ring-1,2-phenylacetyl-CoA epoxidase subunit PaaD [Shouchella lonarensis]
MKESDVWQQLRHVKDPEIETVSIVDLGMVEEIVIDEANVTVTILPTFLGCPALSIIQQNIENRLRALPRIGEVTVAFVRHPPWTSARITDRGREALKAFGIAPPPSMPAENGEWHVACPYCDSTYVTLDNLFGPTACRSILYCKTCKNPFEAMKPIATLSS